MDDRSVLLHCSDGWDRTAQVASLSMLCLDPFYRTAHGFAILIEKEWGNFGHRFRSRIGQGAIDSHQKKDKERAPIFIQFLECVRDLTVWFKDAFEFNEDFLLVIAKELYSWYPIF